MDASSRHLVAQPRSLGVREIFAGRFAIEEEAGRGGMGIVYRAFDRVAERTVALKVLRRSGPSAERRFANEADALGRIDHPNIVRYLAHGISEEGEPYLVLEWIEGESLDVRLDRVAATSERLSLYSVLDLGQQLAGALAAAHAIGIVHRDVKPSNILLVEGDLHRPKLADFGIVRATSETALTTSGVILGTIGYMAPEQARRAEDLDGRADLFSLGCVLFRCITDRDVFYGPDPLAILSMLLVHEPPRVASLRPEVPPELDALVAQLLAKDRDERPASASQVKEVLERISVNLLGATQTSDRVQLPPGDGPARPAPRTKRFVRWAGKAIAATALTGLAIGAAVRAGPWHRSTLRPLVTTVTTATSAAPAGTAITSLPVSPTCTPAAVALHRQGLQAMREGRSGAAAALFEQATKADPSCPEVKLYRVITAQGYAQAATEREYLREAMGFRDALSERDRLMLDAFNLLVAPEEPRHAEASQLLDEAARRFPMDAEVLVMSAIRKLNRVHEREGLEPVLEQLRRATDIDPAYSDAWQIEGKVLDHLGRVDDALAALDQCVKFSPASVDCMGDRIYILRRIGLCAEAETEARRCIAWEPEQPRAYRHLAAMLAIKNAPREGIEEVLVQRWNRLPPDRRERTRLLEGARLAAWMGDFAGVLRSSEALTRQLEGSGAVEWHWGAALLSVDALLEIGDTAQAALVAERVLRRKGAWIKDDANALEAAYIEPWLLAAEVQGGRLAVPEWRAATDKWEQATEPLFNAFERWVFRWGIAVGPRIEAAEAMAHTPPGELRDAVRSAHVSWRMGVLDAYAGRLFLHGGDLAHATSLLESGARSCQGTDFPFINVRAHLWLGTAKEQLGDTEAACEAYRFVIERWGAAKPPSVTAREAERRSRALSCKK